MKVEPELKCCGCESEVFDEDSRIVLDDGRNYPICITCRSAILYQITSAVVKEVTRQWNQLEREEE